MSPELTLATSCGVLLAPVLLGGSDGDSEELGQVLLHLSGATPSSQPAGGSALPGLRLRRLQLRLP